ncbi:hypothetical protein E2562_011731 [Oryza meyeriana var. granulata]|uniref:Uncharacterized protein n=1 Tax=Oryza meyeriana var. granulata TaxID=110450 RepID=A0A6G1DFZ2_9ORYZ|nr:hypothetical protein E2562_011731 [Oryza meyeriana var. granulata]
MRRLDLAEPPCGVLVPLDLEEKGERGDATGELCARVLSSTAVEIHCTSPRASPPRASGQQLRRRRIQSPRPSPLPDRASRASLATAPNSVIGCAMSRSVTSASAADVSGGQTEENVPRMPSGLKFDAPPLRARA